MTFALISRLEDPEIWRQEFRRILPDSDFRVWPNIGDGRDVTMAAFDYDDIREEVFKDLPNLKCVVFLGHGVNDLLKNPILPVGIPVVRLRDPGIVRSMVEYVILHILKHHRFDAKYVFQQKHRHWERHQPRSTLAIQVGVVGLGSAGEATVRALHQLNFRVSGWARRRHQIEGVKCFAGRGELKLFLAPLDYVVCILPLTAETENLIDAEVIAAMKPGAYLINIGRGRLVVDKDLLVALDSGQLSGATLDVFRTEPLPDDNPFWSHPKVLVTPHESGTQPEGSIPDIVENYRRLNNGEALQNLADPTQGY
jgi:glyoxylate/hydroxypyruvate reductase A